VKATGREAAPHDAAEYHGGYSLHVEALQVPLAVCSSQGSVQVATPLALELLRRLSVVDHTPAPLPTELWSLLERTPAGEAVEWRPPGKPGDVLGFTRYAATSHSYLLLMREVSAKHVALSERVHRQRTETTERLVASIAHDIRGPVASIVYSVDFLRGRARSLGQQMLSETLQDIGEASRRLQLTADALLDHAGLGPRVSVPVLLQDVLNRVRGLLGAHYRDGAHRLRVDIAPHAEWVRGNPVVIEQIFVNLLLNSAEASPSPRYVIVTASPSPPPPGREHQKKREEAPFYVCIRVWDDGPGIPASFREFIFDAFFTTKANCTGLGLSIARHAAETLDGTILLMDDEPGTSFAVYLPGCEGPR